MSIAFRLLLLVCGLLMAPPGLRAGEIKNSRLSQEYLVHSWQTDDGLPQNWVSCIAQTPDGYLWIGTRYGGLARFDGLRFVSFIPGTTPELRDVQVESDDVDETGRLWVMMGNESITAVSEGRFELFRQPRAEPRLRAQKVLTVTSNSVLFVEEASRLARLNLGASNSWEILTPEGSGAGFGKAFRRDRTGAVWFITESGGLGRFRNGAFEIPAGRLRWTNSPLTAMALDAQDRLWLATSNAIFCRAGGAFEEVTPTNGPPSRDIQEIVCPAAGGFWVRDGNELRKGGARAWTAGVTLARSVQRENAPLESQLYCDREGNAWLVDYGRGLWCVKGDGSAFEFTDSNGLPNGFITCWFQDREDNIWVGTVGGVARLSKRAVRVLGPDEGLPGRICRSVCLDQQGVLWAGTMSGGLACLQDDRLVSLNLPSVDANTPLESVTVCPTADGSLWIGTLRHGLMRLNADEIDRPISLNDLPFVRILFEDSKHRLWIGGLANLKRYANGQVQTVGTGEGFQTGIAVGAIAEDRSGAIWIGTGPGDLWRFQAGKFTRFEPPQDWPSFRFAALLADADGSIWIGTLGGGLLRFKDGRYCRYTSQQGLPNMFVSQLREDRQGNLWAGTYAGIIRISKTNLLAVAEEKESELICRVYGRSSGLQALECSSGFQPACWTAPDGSLWFSTALGLACVDPKEKAVSADQPPPPVAIEQMLVDGVERSTSRADAPELQIEPGEHFLQFRYTGVSLAAPEEVSFRVKLEGAESKWRELGYQRTVGYGPLAPGHYRLRVLAGGGGVWSEPGASLAFAVQPFFWQTVAFKVLLAIALFVLTSLAVTLAVTRRHRLEMRKLRAQHELDRERARIAQDLHDDLGTNLTQISLLSALADREPAKEEIKSLNQQIRNRARDMVAALDEIVWAVNPRNDSVAELINYLANFADEFFRASAISCRLDIPARLPADALSSEVRHHLYLVFKESINNVARHSQASHVWITVAIQPGEAVLSVRDDGPGFEVSDPGFKPGDGLINMRTRMEQIGGRAEIQSRRGEGTTVVIHLPI